MTPPVVSIIIPSHRPSMLHEAMGSVYGQTFRGHQLLVNCAEDWYPEKINELALAARGEFIAILPDDDLLVQTWMAETVAKAREGYDVVCTDYIRRIKTQDTYWPAQPWTLDSFQSGGCNPVCGSTFLMRRDLWNEIGGIDPEQIFWDWDLAYECFKRPAVTATVIPRPLVVFRVHDGPHDQQDDADAMRRLRAKHPELRKAA